MRFGRKRFVLKNIQKWICLMAGASAMLSTGYYQSMKEFYNEGCILDIFTVLPQNYVFPLLALIYAIGNTRVLKRNVLPVVLLRYGGKNKFWHEQCECTAITAFMATIASCIGSMITAGMFFGKWCNWNKEDSFMQQLYKKEGLNAEGDLDILGIIAGSIITYYLLFFVIGLITLMLENLMKSVTVSVLCTAIICCMDTLVMITGIPVFFCRFQTKRIMWIQPEMWFINVMWLLLMVISLYILGKNVIERREYY